MLQTALEFARFGAISAAVWSPGWKASATSTSSKAPACLGHEPLGVERLLRWLAVVAHGTRQAPILQHRVQGQRRAELRRAEKAVATGGARPTRLHRSPLGHTGLLQQTGQGVELAMKPITDPPLPQVAETAVRIPLAPVVTATPAAVSASACSGWTETRSGRLRVRPDLPGHARKSVGMAFDPSDER